MASDRGMSPPGRPGFQIRPLKPDEEIPSGRREYWLTRHDHKHHFKHKNFKLNTLMNLVINIKVINVQFH